MNFMFFSMELLCSVKFSMSYSCMTTNVSSTYLSHIEGGLGAVLKANSSKLLMTPLLPLIFIYRRILIYIYKVIIWLMDSMHLCGKVGSFSSLFLMIFRAGSAGMFVKSAITSYSTIFLPGGISKPLIFLIQSWLFLLYEVRILSHEWWKDWFQVFCHMVWYVANGWHNGSEGDIFLMNFR